MSQTMNNKDYVDRWRNRTGNRKRKSKYNELRNKGVDYKQASIMRYWSDERIELWFIDREVVDKDA